MIGSLVRTLALVFAAMLVATPASAQLMQSLQFGVGGFFPRNLDSRVTGDVWVANLNQPDVAGYPGTTASLEFDPDSFHGWTIFGEWALGFRNRFELGVGASYYSRTAHSRYRDLENGIRPSHPDIEQDLKLRITPISVVGRFLPFGRPSDFQPYVGGGFSIMNFRYTETGEFVDPETLVVFPEQYKATGTTVGPLILAGLRIPLKGDIYGLTFEGRYQWGAGNTGGAAANFLGDKIDLGGGSLNFGFLVRF
jgi:outer membrane protein W